MPHWNNHDRVWDKPTHNSSGDWHTAGVLRKDAALLFGWPKQDGRTGFSLAARQDGSDLSGDVLWPGHENDKEPFVPDPRKLEGYPFFCSEFQASKCPSNPPLGDEKVVVFMRHGSAACEQDGRDPLLNELGETQARERKMYDPNLLKAMSSDPSLQAQVILISPLVRAMHTALLAFSQHLPHAKWEIDPNLVELGGVGTIIRGAGERLLRNFNATELLRQYRTLGNLTSEDLPESRHHHHEHRDHHSHQDRLRLIREEGLDEPWLENLEKALEAEPARAALGASLDDVAGAGDEAQDGPELEQRFWRFTQRLLRRPEKRFIAVSHKHILKAGIDIPLDQTETVLMALSPNGLWRRLPEPPHCWPGAL